MNSTMSVNGQILPWSPPRVTARDVDGDPLTWSLRKSPSHGIATVEGLGGTPSVLVFTPQLNFVGKDSLRSK